MNEQRYARQTLLPWIQEKGQRELVRKKVLVIGAGALGSHIVISLVRSGIGFLKIIDRDIVEPPDLSRQVYDEEDALRNKPKVFALRDKIKKINSEVKIECKFEDVWTDNITHFIQDIDVIVDATDNFETRFLINDVSFKYKIPWIYGSCVREQGQMSAFYPERTACFRCLIDEMPHQSGQSETCDTVGVSGEIVQIISSFQVNAVLKILLDANYPLNTLFFVDLSSYKFLSFKFSRKRGCPICEENRFEFLENRKGYNASPLCGTGTVLVRLKKSIPLSSLFKTMKPLGDTIKTDFFLKFKREHFEMLIFPEGRVLVREKGLKPERARSLVSKFIGI